MSLCHVVHEMSWVGVKTGEQKKMRSGATAWRSVGKSLEGRGVESWQCW